MSTKVPRMRTSAHLHVNLYFYSSLLELDLSLCYHFLNEVNFLLCYNSHFSQFAVKKVVSFFVILVLLPTSPIFLQFLP